MTISTEHLADRLAVIDTVVAYSTAVDTRNWALFESLFTDDAVWEYGAGRERHVGAAAITARVRPVERLDATQHYVSNHVVDLTGDEALHTCYYQAQHVHGGGRFLAGGRYEDRLRRTGSGWRFAARTLVSVWSEGDMSVLSAVAEARNS